MTGLEYFVVFAATGRVEDVGLGSSPQEFEERLGDDYIDDRKKNRMRRDYGLVELTFSRGDGSWRCTNITLQTHRLWSVAVKSVPDKLADKYGDFPSILVFGDLRQELERVKYEVSLIGNRRNLDYSRYFVEATKVIITVVESASDEVDDIPAGAVWSMNLSTNADGWIDILARASH